MKFNFRISVNTVVIVVSLIIFDLIIIYACTTSNCAQFLSLFVFFTILSM